MATKTLTIKEEVYNRLRHLKRDDESFSDLLYRLTTKISTLDLLKSMAGTIDFDDADALKEEINEKRRQDR